MNTGGDAAEQIVRMSLEGFEVAAKLTGAGAKNIAVLLYTILKEEQKTKGKARLTSMLRSGKELKVFTVKNEDLKRFTQEAKKYGVLYNWYGAMDQENAQGGSADAVPSGVQGICPAGWHLPSKAEWQVLEDYVASQLPPVKGNGWYNDLDGEWVFDEDCKNVWRVRKVGATRMLRRRIPIWRTGLAIRSGSTASLPDNAGRPVRSAFRSRRRLSGRRICRRRVADMSCSTTCSTVSNILNSVRSLSAVIPCAV